jgi:hypothetical protein
MEVVLIRRLVAKMSDRFQQKFCVKLRKNARDTSAVLSEAYGGQAMKRSRVSERHKRFKENSHVEITNEDKAHSFL